MGLTLVLGGIRSGKSQFAESRVALPACYVATMRPRTGDAELDQRIERHQSRRGDGWTLVEAANGIVKAVGDAPNVLLDGFGLVVAAALESPDPALAVFTEVARIIEDSRHREWIIVSEEVGFSLVAADRLSRQFQDVLGEANQRFAAASSAVYLVVVGRPLLLTPA